MKLYESKDQLETYLTNEMENARNHENYYQNKYSKTGDNKWLYDKEWWEGYKVAMSYLLAKLDHKVVE